ncbi:MAG: iron ABC transporter permease [Chloroflexota bacterium]|nr:iron ABC transporter permease [Chloroflexota bacterium]
MSGARALTGAPTGGAASRSPWRGTSGGGPLAVGLGVILAVLVLVPLAFLGLASFKPTGFVTDPGFGIGNYIDIYSDTSTYGLIGTSLLFSTASTLLAVVMGLLLAWIIERTDVPARAILRVLVLLPMAIPPILLAIGWVLLLSPQIGVVNRLLVGSGLFPAAPLDVYSMPGMIAIQALSFVPSTFLILAPAFRNMDAALEEASFTSGAGTFHTVRRVSLPMLLPAIIAAAALLWIIGLLVFDVPGIIGLPAGVRVFSVEVYFGTHPAAGVPNYGQVAALSVVFVVVTLIASAFYLRATRNAARFTTISGRGYRPRPLRLGSWRYGALATVCVYLLLTAIAPILMLLWESFSPYYSSFLSLPLTSLTLKNFDVAMKDSGMLSAAWHTTIVAGTAAVAVTILSALLSWAVIRIRVPARQLLDTIAFLPLAIPATMTAVALAVVYLSLRYIPIYGTVWILALAYLTIYLPFGTRTTNGVFIQISRDLEDAAHVSGASHTTTLRTITVPLVLPSLLMVGIWVAVHAARDLAVPLMLQATGNTVLATLVWTFWQAGMGTATAAVGVTLIAGAFVLVVGWQYLEHLREQRSFRSR